MLKAIVVKENGEMPPRTHNLIFLSEKANLSFEEETEIFVGILMKYQLQGRYPDYNPLIPNKLIILEYLETTEKLMLWLEKKL